MAGLAGDQPRSPARATPERADPRLLTARQHPRAALRPRAAIVEAGLAAALLLTGLTPAMPPAVRRRRRHAERGRGRPQRHPPLDRQHQLMTATQAELGVTVKLHPGPPSRVSRGRPTASKEARTTSQPFTTCRGTSARWFSAYGPG